MLTFVKQQSSDLQMTPPKQLMIVIKGDGTFLSGYIIEISLTGMFVSNGAIIPNYIQTLSHDLLVNRLFSLNFLCRPTVRSQSLVQLRQQREIILEFFNLFSLYHRFI